MAIYQNTAGEQLNLSDQQANTFQGGSVGLEKSGYRLVGSAPIVPPTAPTAPAAPIVPPTLPTTQPIITTSSYVNDYAQSLKNYADNNRSLIQQQLEDLKTQSAARAQEIEAGYQAQSRRLAQQQAEEKATSDVAQFRLGRSGTPFATAEGQKLNDLQNAQRQELAGQRQSLLNQVNQALAEGKFKLANSLIEQDKTLAEQQFNIQKQQQVNAPKVPSYKIPTYNPPKLK